MPWLRLLDRYRSECGFGLTLPFLLGATLSPLERFSWNDVLLFRQLLRLLRSMRDDTPVAYSVLIAPCCRTRQPVATLLNGRPQPGPYSGIPSAGGERTALYVADRLFPGSEMLEQESLVDLGRGLWLGFETDVVAGRFSCRGGALEAFDGSELEFIRRALALAGPPSAE